MADDQLRVHGVAEYNAAFIVLFRAQIDALQDVDAAFLFLKVLTGLIGDGGTVKGMAEKLGNWSLPRFHKAVAVLETAGLITVWHTAVARRTRPELHLALATPQPPVPQAAPPAPQRAARPPRPTRIAQPVVQPIALFPTSPVAETPWGNQPAKALMQLWEELQGLPVNSAPDALYAMEVRLAASITKKFTPDDVRRCYAEQSRMFYQRPGETRRIPLRWLSEHIVSTKGTDHDPSRKITDLDAIQATERTNTPDLFRFTDE